MDDILDLTGNLAKRLRETNVYKEYTASRDSIHKDEELILKLYRFKKLNSEYQLKIMNNIQPSFEDEKKLSAIYWELLLDDNARLFLESEKKLVEMLSKIYDTLSDSCDLEMII